MSPAVLTDQQIRRMRTASLLLSVPPVDSVAAVARWFGAMQSQDYASGLWSFGVRLPHLSVGDVIEAVRRGEVLRTWPMRGTMHFVAAEDAGWLLETTGRRQLSGVQKRWEYLGLDEVTVTAAAELLDQHLSAAPMARADVLALLTESGIDCSGQRGYHLLWYAAQVAISCLGPNEGSQATYVRLADWAPEQRALHGDEALAELAVRYFRSHGPTTRQDFAGWAGIGQREARTGIAGAGPLLRSAVAHSGAELWFAADLPEIAGEILAGAGATTCFALPGFDEFILGFKDRSVQLPAAHADAIIPGGNGVFRPTLVRDGGVLGTWTRTIKRDRVVIEPQTFTPASGRTRTAADRAFADYARFLGLTAEVRW